MTKAPNLDGRLIAFAAVILATAAMAAAPTVTTEATGTANFSLSKPDLRPSGSGFTISGLACRRARSTLLSPQSIRIEHVAATGEVAQNSHSYLPTISRQNDRRCSHYFAKVDWTLADGDLVRVCFDHGQACPKTPEVKAVVKDPSPPAISTP